uniref:SMODS and SLOG-associating 2TM effector domain-containing protein n=1 Tax=viral metagenome TaxID=1070528 RepID=A0A6C0K9H9_9ZZZZ
MSLKNEDIRPEHKTSPNLPYKVEKLLSKTEALVLLCSKASGYWSMVKFAFNIPLVLTSSAMCIINSISEDANEVKIPNIVVNAISVLIISLNNSIKASEKCDLFRRLGQQFLLLAGQIENDDEINDNEFNLLALKYENLINDILFEEIPNRYKMQVVESFKDRHLPLQLNGTIGNNKSFVPPSNSAEIVMKQQNAMNSMGNSNA